MSYKIEKNEQYALISLTEAVFGENIAAPLEKNVVGLYREGFINIVADFDKVSKIDDVGFNLIKKITKVCGNEGGLFIIATKNDEVIDKLDSEKIPDLLILPTLDEAIDAAFMNELENEFKEADDDEFDLEDGFSVENEK